MDARRSTLVGGAGAIVRPQVRRGRRSGGAGTGRAAWLRAVALGLAIVTALAAPGSAAATCSTTSTAHCLQGSRFRVEAEWADFVGSSGEAQTVPGATADSGLFYFYGPNNWELLVKVLNGCQQNDRFWVFAAAATTLEYTLIVTDTLTGAVRAYSNPLGRESPSITDTEAFDTCDGTVSGARVQYFNALTGDASCTGPLPFTSTLFVGRYSWQSISGVPSVYQMVSLPELGPTFTEVNGSACGGFTYNGTLALAAGHRYVLAQMLDAGERVLNLYDEGAALVAGGDRAAAAVGAEPRSHTVALGAPVQRIAASRSGAGEILAAR